MKWKDTDRVVGFVVAVRVRGDTKRDAQSKAFQMIMDEFERSRIEEGRGDECTIRIMNTVDFLYDPFATPHLVEE